MGGEVHVDGGINRETAEIAAGSGRTSSSSDPRCGSRATTRRARSGSCQALADEGYQSNFNDGVRAGAARCSRGGRSNAGVAAARDTRLGPGRCRGRRRDRERTARSCWAWGQPTTPRRGSALARRIAELRIFEDEEGRTNRSLIAVGGEALVVSQFTLFADTIARPSAWVHRGGAARAGRRALPAVLRGPGRAGTARGSGRVRRRDGRGAREPGTVHDLARHERVKLR